MGFLCISQNSVTHLTSLQAWVFGALDNEDRAPIYWTNALLYLLPWLSRGFELDRFSIACLIAGVIHIQVRPTLEYSSNGIPLDKLAMIPYGGKSVAEEYSDQFYHSIIDPLP